jgi:hypothetical protein
VVTAFTCNGGTRCTLNIDEPFSLRVSFTDADGNASGWQLWGILDDVLYAFDSGIIDPPSGGTTFTWKSPLGFSCPGGSCRGSEWELVMVITDSEGFESDAAYVNVTVLGNV